MAKNINFPNNKAYEPDTRAYAEVFLMDSSGTLKSAAYKCLVDTGADYIVLPQSAASSVGIQLSGNKKTIRGVYGSVTLDFEPGLNIQVEGNIITADVLFDPAGSGFVPILGRIAMVEAFDVGFDDSDWLWT